MQMNRRKFMMGSAATGIALTGAGLAQAVMRPLPLIPMTDLTKGVNGRINLSLNKARHDFGNGVMSNTLGINNSYLGPVLRIKQGQTLPVDVVNQIEEVTTLHWHGLHIPGDVDGGPHQEIPLGEVWSPDVPITQRASMNWFHAHTHGRTAQQTYRGLAGVLLVEDDASLSADLPQTYGVDEFTLVLQDKAFDEAGQMSYVVTGAALEDGFMGDTVVVNGAMAPVGQDVPSGLVRLRILNACNARFLTLSMAAGPVTVIASDGGFLASPVEAENILVSPGERYEILVDMSRADSNSLMVSFQDEGAETFFQELLTGLFGPGTGEAMVALTLTRSSDTGFTGSMPQSLASLSPPNRADAVRTRSFELLTGDGDQLAALALAQGELCGNGAVMGINGQPMNMNTINERVSRGETEIWRITPDHQLHPFHIHGCSFRILTQDGVAPPSYAAGWKDMVHVGEGGWSEVLVRFDHTAPDNAPYMYHCHILEHEDCGMMGQFTVG